MFVVRRPRAPRSLLVALALAVTFPVLTVPGAAAADDEVSTGDTVVGEFAQVWPEYEDPDAAAEHGDEGPLSYVRTDDGESVRVDSDDVEDLEVGATVELTVGREIRDTASEELGYDEARNVLDTQVLEAPIAETDPAPAPASPPYTHAVTVVMVNPAGGVRDTTALADVVATVNGTVADFYERESNNVIKLGVVAQHDWIDTTVGCADPWALWSEVATRVGFTVGSGTLQDNLLMLYVTKTPAMPACSYGLAEVGNYYSDPGNFSYVRDNQPSVIAHELGHNLGLRHAASMQCTEPGYPSFDCENIDEYGDLYDVMGASWGPLGSLNVVQSDDLGFLNTSDSFGAGAATRTVTLAPVSQRAGIRALKLVSYDSGDFWLEYRPAAGQDAWLGTADNRFGLLSGVLLRKPSYSDDYGSFLLDGTQSPEADWDADLDAALPVGSPLRIHGSLDQRGAFIVTVQSVSPVTGATVQVAWKSAITLEHEELGGNVGVLGTATGAEQCDTSNVCRQPFQYGEIVHDPDYGTHAIQAPVHAAWVASGGLDSWGTPASDATCGLPAGGCSQSFASGLSVYWAPAVGLQTASGGIRDYFLERGGPGGVLGYPTAEVVCRAGRCWQPFQGGEVTWAPSAGARMLQGGIRGAWFSTGGWTGPLGSAVTEMVCGLPQGGCGQHFEGGSLFWSPTTGTQAMYGAIRDRWFRQNGQEGSLGYPTGNMYCTWHCIQYYQGGTIVWSASTGAVAVAGAISGRWQADGATAGALGLPTGEIVCGLNRGGCAQHYQGGSIYWSPATGAQSVHGAIRDAYWRQRGQDGRLVYPTSSMSCFAGTCRVTFQRGEITWSPRTGSRVRNY